MCIYLKEKADYSHRAQDCTGGGKSADHRCSISGGVLAALRPVASRVTHKVLLARFLVNTLNTHISQVKLLPSSVEATLALGPASVAAAEVWSFLYYF